MAIEPILQHWALDPHFLHGRMSFICGPRQIGKTTLAQKHLERQNQLHNYHNWDSLSLRRKFAADPLFFLENIGSSVSTHKSFPPGKRPWIVFDEIHKYPKWKNLLKGYYDEWKSLFHFVVTGSARLDFYRRSGDSLVGRYFLFRMNPLHPHDLTGFSPVISSAWHPKTEILPFDEPEPAFREAAFQLFEVSGFPEPFSVGTKDFYLRWKDNHISLITNEDLRDLTKITSLQKLQTLVFLLPERVGAPLSLNNLKETLQCAHASVQSWLEALEKAFLVFHIAPFSGKLKRSILKEKKFYFWDWGVHEDPGKRFENLIAVQLQRAVSTWNEWGKGEYRLMYARTRDGREADFVVTEKNRPFMLVECKINEKAAGPSVAYFKDRLGVPAAIQVIDVPGYLRQAAKGIFVVGLDRFLRLLP